MKIMLIGAALETGNLGVSALGYSVINALNQRIEDLNLVILDFGRGIRQKKVRMGADELTYTAIGSTITKNIFRSDSLYQLYLFHFFKLKNNLILNEFLSIDCALDITGGDSFTDLYGIRRFRATYLRKKFIYKINKKLILLPQTYGPYADKKVKRQAKSLIERSSGVWARDEISFRVIEELFSNGNAPEVNLSPDVAFTLPFEKIEDKIVYDEINRIFESDEANVKVGLNISGLLFGEKNRTDDFGIKFDYREFIFSFIEKILEDPNFSIYLIPHVFSITPFDYCDKDACMEVYEKIKIRFPDRIHYVSQSLNQCEIKWVIRNMDWFSGARMHSTIASLSSKVPTVVQAYSDKALGVFKICKQEENVIDLRCSNYENLIDILYHSLVSRNDIKKELDLIIPQVVSDTEKQFDDIVKRIESLI